ncbi:hypothetical protein BDZ45DRAFT_731901 [Acephala macrosclerotiorum]|nr:hypothetical protein BDZ45DRAFT_731901 [Acephala macrosclerotiorum]
MHHIGLVHLPHTALPNRSNPKPWYRHPIRSSKAALKMDPRFMDSSTHIDRPDKFASPSDKIDYPDSIESAQYNTTTSSTDKGKSLDREQIHPMTPSPNSKTKVTIEDFYSADENEDQDHPTSPTNNIKFNVVKSKKHSPHADPEDEHDHRKITCTGLSALYESGARVGSLKDGESLPTPPTSDEKTTDTEDMDSNLKSPTRPSKNKSGEDAMENSPLNSSTSSNDTKINFPDPDTIKITFSSDGPSSKPPKNGLYDKQTFQTTLPPSLSDAKFTIPILDTRESLLLASMDLAARFDNKFHFTEYSNSLLRREAEEKGRKIEELEWKGKFKDAQSKLGEKENENKDLKRELIGERSDKPEKDDGIEKLKDELAGEKENLEALEKRGEFVFGDAEEEISRLRGKVENLEKDLKGVKGDWAGAEDENSGLKERIVNLEELLSVEKMKLSEETMKLIGREEKVAMLENKVEMLNEKKGECEMICDGLRRDLDNANGENWGLEKSNKRLEKGLAAEKESPHLRDLVGTRKDGRALEERIKGLQKENSELKKAATGLEIEVLNHRTRATEMITMLEGLVGHPVRQALGDVGSSAVNKQAPTRGQPYGLRGGRGSHKFFLTSA